MDQNEIINDRSVSAPSLRHQDQSPHRQSGRDAGIREHHDGTDVVRDDDPLILRRNLQDAIIGCMQQAGLPGGENLDARVATTKAQNDRPMNILVELKARTAQLRPPRGIPLSSRRASRL
jgi:hypothetical protein